MRGVGGWGAEQPKEEGAPGWVKGQCIRKGKVPGGVLCRVLGGPGCGGARCDQERKVRWLMWVRSRVIRTWVDSSGFWVCPEVWEEGELWPCLAS